MIAYCWQDYWPPQFWQGTDEVYTDGSAPARGLLEHLKSRLKALVSGAGF